MASKERKMRGITNKRSPLTTQEQKRGLNEVSINLESWKIKQNKRTNGAKRGENSLFSNC